VILFLAMSCITESGFDARFSEEYCRYAQECEVLDLEGFSTLSECERETGFLSEDCEEFDRKQARECLQKVAEMSCAQGMSGTPRACNTVCP